MPRIIDCGDGCVQLCVYIVVACGARAVIGYANKRPRVSLSQGRLSPSTVRRPAKCVLLPAPSRRALEPTNFNGTWSMFELRSDIHVIQLMQFSCAREKSLVNAVWRWGYTMGFRTP